MRVIDLKKSVIKDFWYRKPTDLEFRIALIRCCIKEKISQFKDYADRKLFGKYYRVEIAGRLSRVVQARTASLAREIIYQEMRKTDSPVSRWGIRARRIQKPRRV